MSLRSDHGRYRCSCNWCWFEHGSLISKCLWLLLLVDSAYECTSVRVCPHMPSAQINGFVYFRYRLSCTKLYSAPKALTLECHTRSTKIQLVLSVIPASRVGHQSTCLGLRCKFRDSTIFHNLDAQAPPSRATLQSSTLRGQFLPICYH